jgi:hypothetical protein
MQPGCKSVIFPSANTEPMPPTPPPALSPLAAPAPNARDGRDDALSSPDRRAWAQHEATIRAFPTAPCPDTDVWALCTSVEGVVSKLSRFRDKVCALPDFDSTWFDELGSLTRAVRATATEAKVVQVPTNTLRPLVRRLADAEKRLRLALRLRLAATGRTLEALETLDAPGRGGPGTGTKFEPRDRRVPAQRAEGVLDLVALLRHVGFDGVGLEPNDLERAEDHALAVIAHRSPSERPPADVAEVRLLQANALSLLAAVYDEVRAAVWYVGRHEPGIEQIMPPLWSLRGKRIGRRGGGRGKGA